MTGGAGAAFSVATAEPLAVDAFDAAEHEDYLICEYSPFEAAAFLVAPFFGGIFQYCKFIKFEAYRI